MLRKHFLLIASICLISLLFMSPLVTGFWARYFATINSVYDIQDGKLKRLAYKTSVVITPTDGVGNFIIQENTAFNYFDENGTYIKTIYFKGQTDFFRFVHGELQHSQTQSAMRTEDTLRNSDNLYTDSEAVVRNY